MNSTVKILQKNRLIIKGLWYFFKRKKAPLYQYWYKGIIGKMGVVPLFLKSVRRGAYNEG